MNSLSKLFHFTSFPPCHDFAYIVGIFGDFGLDHAVSIDSLYNEVHKYSMRLIIHVGKFDLKMNTIS